MPNVIEIDIGESNDISLTVADTITVVGVPTDRVITAGAGLTGGGDLSADRTLNVVANADGSIVVNANDLQVGILATDGQHGDRGGASQHSTATTSVAGFMSASDKIKLNAIPASAVPTSRIVTAGGGLTGGGDLSSDRTLNVIANADGSIVVNADDLQVGILATDAQHGNRGGGSQHAIATTSVDGFMSAADKTKMDAIPASPVSTSRIITAGAGLTGGGDLSSDRTIAVGANLDGSIVVGADTVGVGTLATDGQHGDRGGGTLHATAVASGAAGFLSGTDKAKLDSVTVANIPSTTEKAALAGTGTPSGANKFVTNDDSRLSDTRTPTDGTVTTAKLVDASVTLAKMANLAQDTLIGRATASTGVPEAITLTSAGRALIDDADASTQRTTLGLGTLATQNGTFSGTHSGTSSGTNTGDQTVTLTSDVTGSGTGSFATTIANDAVTNAKLANVAAHTFKGNNTGSTTDPIDMTATQATAELNAVVGDSGSGGTKGLVPAPASGDAAAGKILSADGTWSVAWQMIQDLEYFGNYIDGDLTVSSGTTTLTRDMHYRDVVVSGTAVIATQGFAIRCRSLDLTNAPANCIIASGPSGNNASGTALGSGGNSTTNSIWGKSTASGSGALGSAASNTSTGSANVGGATTDLGGSLGGVGGVGGANNSGTAGGSSGIFAAAAQHIANINNMPVAGTSKGTAYPGVSTGGIGGGSGRSGLTSGSNGGGGGGGSGSDNIVIFARTISRGGSTAAGCIKSSGGVGGNGGIGTTVVNQGGGGGAGGGGGGGVIVIIYRYITGSTATNALQSNGGAGGNGGDAGGSSAIGGTGGSGGNGGIIYIGNITAGTWTRTAGSTGSAATTASTQTGTSGGSAGTCSVSL